MKTDHFNLLRYNYNLQLIRFIFVDDAASCMVVEFLMLKGMSVIIITRKGISVI